MSSRRRSRFRCGLGASARTIHRCTKGFRFPQVPAVIPSASEEETIVVVNDSVFGHGGTVWVSGTDHGLV